MKNLMVRGNTKMGKQVAVFNLPPVKTCTPTAWCLRGRDGKPRCYALRNNCIMKSVVEATAWRLSQSRRDDFVQRVVAELKGRYGFVRIHSTGDFYSAEYVRKWAQIASALPEVLFRTTTRRRDLTRPIRKLASLPNVVVRESLDTSRPAPKMGLPFAAIDGLPVSREAFMCPSGCEACGHACWKSRSSMRFEEH